MHPFFQRMVAVFKYLAQIVVVISGVSIGWIVGFAFSMTVGFNENAFNKYIRFPEVVLIGFQFFCIFAGGAIGMKIANKYLRP